VILCTHNREKNYQVGCKYRQRRKKPYEGRSINMPWHDHIQKHHLLYSSSR